MVTHTLGSGPRTAVLLHGGGLSWWNYRAVADLLAANGYRVVLPVLDGHAAVTDGAETITLERGDTFAVGASARPRFTGRARILLALPPLSTP